MSTTRLIAGRPGLQTKLTAGFRLISPNGTLSLKEGAGVFNGAESRDPNNTGSTYVLRAGTILAKNSGKYAPWAIGSTAGALTNSGTSITLAAAEAVELVRRVGASGTFILTGPPTSGGTTRQLTVTYSAVNTSTGVVTITALGVNEVQTVNLATAATGGSIRLVVQKTDGTFALTPAAAWSATDATLLSNLQTALDTATGVTNGIVASAIAATDTDLGFVLTYSGTGYAGNTWALASVNTLFTSNTGANVVRTTTGVDGRFVAGSVVSKSGWQTPLTLVPDGAGQFIPTDGTDAEGHIPDAGKITDSQLLPYPADTSLRQFIRTSLRNASGGGVFVFDSLT